MENFFNNLSVGMLYRSDSSADTGTDKSGAERQQLMCVKYEVGPCVPSPEYTPEDISENKIFAMLPYLMGLLGVIAALLGAGNSKYVGFHVRQALKLSVCTVLLAILAVPFIILGRIPYLGIIFFLVALVILAAELLLFAVRLISFFQVCEGKAKEPAIIGGFEMFK